MKKILASFCAWLMIAGLMPLTAVAQSTIGASRVAGRFVAVNYNYGASAPSLGLGNPPAPSIPPLKVYNGNAAAGSGTITLSTGYIVSADGHTFFPLCAGSNVTGTITCGGATPITVNPGGANSETVTPTAVSGCNQFPANSSNPTCQVTATFANVHAQGENIQSGSAGLQEAINDAIASGGGMATIDALWTKAGGTQAMATAWTAPSGSAGVWVEDLRPSNFGYLVAQPGLTAIPAPAALTTAATATLTTSTTGGSIATAQTPRFTVTALDQFGFDSAAADDSAATATLVDGAGSTNSYGITAAGVPTGTGIVGYHVWVSASGGATQTETLVPAASLICGAAPLSPVPNSCAPGVPITITALPPTTAAGVPVGTAAAATALATAHTTAVIRQMGTPPFMSPFVNVAPAGFFNVTATSAAGSQTMGELQYPAGLFNSLGRSFRLCFGGVTTPSAPTVVGTWAVTVGQRQNSAATASTATAQTWKFVASTQWTAAPSTFESCQDITTTVTGTAAKVESHASSFGVVVTATGIDGAGIQTYLPGISGVSGAFDATLQGVIDVTYLQTANSWTVPQIRYMSLTAL